MDQRRSCNERGLTVILEEAILEWETLNPGLKFEKAGSNPDVVIRWENFPELGTATCEGECTRSDTIDYTVRLSIGTEDCLGEFAYMSREYIKGCSSRAGTHAGHNGTRGIAIA